MKTKIILALALTLSGCAYFPLRPGTGTIQSSTGGGAYIKQSQNPQQESSQKYKKVTEFAPNIILKGKSGLVDTNQVARVTEEGETHIGAAQKDTAREVGAKLSSLKGVVWIGILVFLFGAVSFVYPPVKILVGGSVTTSAVITGSGLGLIILPSLLVGHEVLILGCCVGAAVLYWFAHRHGNLKGVVDTLKSALNKE